jgi:hypothetical protein
MSGGANRAGCRWTLTPTTVIAGGARIVLNPQRPILLKRCELKQLALRRQFQGVSGRAPFAGLKLKIPPLMGNLNP